MANNLTIAIGADTAKLRADLALAQAQLKQFGTDLRNASQQALKTGDTSPVAAIAADFERARAGVAALGKELSLAKGHVEETKSAFSELKAAGGEAIAKPLEAFEKLATLEIPDLAILLGPAAVAAVGAAAAFGYLAKSAADAVRELRNESATLGITTEAFEGLRFAAATVGVTQDELLRNVTRFTADIGRAKQEQEGLDAKTELHAEKLVETQRQLNDAVETTRLAASRAALASKEAAQAIIDADRGLEASRRSVQKALQALDDLKRPPDAATIAKRHKEDLEQNLKDTIAAEKKAEETAKAAREKQKQGEEQAKIDLKKARDAQITAEKQHWKAMLETVAKGLDDLNQQQQGRGISGQLREIASGSGASANVIEQLKEYADRIKALGTATAQANMARQDLGRGFASFMPLLRQGAEGLERLFHASEQFTVTATPAEEKMAGDFTVAWTKVSTVLEGLRVAIGNIVGQLITPQLTALAEWFSENRENIRAWAQTFVDGVRMVGQALKDVVNFSPVGGLFTALTGADATTGLGVAVAGFTALAAAVAAASVAFSLLSALFAPLFSIFVAMGPAIVAFAAGLSNVVELFGILAAGVAWPAILLAGLVALGAVLLTQGQAWQNFKISVEAAWNLMQAFAGWVARGFVSVWDAVAGAVKTAFDTIIYWISYAFGLAQQRLSTLIDVAAKIAGFFGKGPAPSSSPSTETVPVSPAADGKASGGMIRGPGTGTSDQVPIWGSNGEWVIKAKAVAHYGSNFMNAVNNMRFNIRQAQAGYAEGGLIGRLMGPLPQMTPAFADGGMVSQLGGSTSLGNVFRPTVINLDGWSHTLWAPQATIDGLARAANRKRRVSLGRAPSWEG